MENNELKLKILDDIKKTGFITELNVVSWLIGDGWEVKSNFSYIDKDLNKHREIDCIATKMIYDDKNNIIVEMNLIIEIKKSGRAWVIFTNDVPTESRFPGWSMLCISSDNALLDYDEFGDGYVRTREQKIGRSFHEAMKNPNEPSKIYEAILSACKAAVSEYDISKFYHDMDKDAGEERTGYGMSVFIPVVLLDGNLFEAFLDEQGEVQLEERDHIPVAFSYSSYKYDDSRYYPEVITLNGLEGFAQKVGKWSQTIQAHAATNRSLQEGWITYSSS